VQSSNGMRARQAKTRKTEKKDDMPNLQPESGEKRSGRRFSTGYVRNE